MKYTAYITQMEARLPIGHIYNITQWYRRNPVFFFCFFFFCFHAESARDLYIIQNYLFTLIDFKKKIFYFFMHIYGTFKLVFFI